MNLLDIILGIISVISFVFSIYAYYKTESKKQIEMAKNAMVKEKLKAILDDIRLIYYNADLIIQTPKSRDNVTVNELQNIARTIRGQAHISIGYLTEEEQKLNKWKFGEMIDSVEIQRANK